MYGLEDTLCWQLRWWKSKGCDATYSCSFGTMALLMGLEHGLVFEEKRMMRLPAWPVAVL